MNVLIVGGVAAGPKAASKIMQMKPDAEVTTIEGGVFLSYTDCGLPYYVSGNVKEQKDLMCTPAGAVRVDIAATVILAGTTLDDVANLDLSYAPPYAPAMDNLITAANVARNKRDGHTVGIWAEDVYRKIQDGDDFVFLDVCPPQED